MIEFQECIDIICDLPWVYILIFLILIIAVLKAFECEYNDLFCCEPYECAYGNGSSYRKGKIKHDDTPKEILRKIRISSKYDESSVYWRRSLILAFIFLIFLSFFLLRRMPTAYETIVIIVISYLIIYLFQVYYRENLSACASKQISKATEKMEKYFESS